MTRSSETRPATSPALAPVLIAIAAMVAACSHPLGAAPKPADPSAIYERSSHRLAQAPADAAACIAQHAQSRGYSADMVPLYGMESVAVTVKTATAGDVLAVLSLTRSDAGAVAATTTWTGTLDDRAGFLSALTHGC